MVAKISTVAPIGFDGAVVEVESDAKNGLPTIQIVGMGNKAVDEAKERVRSAIRNSLLDFPSKRSRSILLQQNYPKTVRNSTSPLLSRFSLLVASFSSTRSKVQSLLVSLRLMERFEL